MCAKKIDFYFVCFGKKVKNNKSLNTHTSLWTGFDKSSVVSAAGAERKKGTKSWKGLFGEGKPPINGCASLLVRVNLSWLKNWAPPTEKRKEEARREERRREVGRITQRGRNWCLLLGVDAAWALFMPFVWARRLCYLGLSGEYPRPFNLHPTKKKRTHTYVHTHVGQTKRSGIRGRSWSQSSLAVNLYYKFNWICRSLFALIKLRVLP